MIKSIEIRNFKSIKKKFFPLKNLNILLGLNGTGKSSFIQTLLMLKQSNQGLLLDRLNLNGDYIEIGTTKDALYQYSKQEDFALDINFDDGGILNLELKYEMEKDFFKVINSKKNFYGEYSILESILKQSLFTDSFHYLSANRIEPHSMYSKNPTSVVTKKNIGNRGEFTAHYIDSFSNYEIEYENLLHKYSTLMDSVTGKEIVNKTLINQINLWLGDVSPGVNVKTTSISSEYVLLEYVFKQPNFGNTNRYSPQNVGFGITYSLPVITALLSAKSGEILVIENPEAHIHPRGQAELGKLIALVAMNNVQIIIETHSDHILNGIRVAVKEGNISKDKVVAFYFDKVVEPTEQYSKITNIEIGQNGELSDYPTNMLDEWSNQLLKLL